MVRSIGLCHFHPFVAIISGSRLHLDGDWAYNHAFGHLSYISYKELVAPWYTLHIMGQPVYPSVMPDVQGVGHMGGYPICTTHHWALRCRCFTQFQLDANL